MVGDTKATVGFYIAHGAMNSVICNDMDYYLYTLEIPRTYLVVDATYPEERHIL